VQDGPRTRVFGNQIFEKHHRELAVPGSSVAGVPSGTGSMVLANDAVEIFGNDLRNNNSTDISVISRPRHGARRGGGRPPRVDHRNAG
jgi:hypothetical protein